MEKNMELEQMSSAELISLVRRQERELAKARAAQQGGRELPQDDFARLLDAAVDIYYDGVENQPGEGCYASDAFPEIMAEARAALAQRAASVPAQAGQKAAPVAEATMNMALAMVDACMDATQVEPEDAAAWQIVRSSLAAPVPAASVQPVSDCEKCSGHGCTHYPDGEWEGKCAACEGTGVKPDIGRDAALEPFSYVVVDEHGNPEFVAADRNNAQEHINDAISEHDIEGAVKWKAVAAYEMRPSDDKLWDETISDRDQYHEWADKLADAIANYFQSDIGEHSNINCPWAEAVRVIEEAPALATQAAPEVASVAIAHEKIVREYQRGFDAGKAYASSSVPEVASVPTRPEKE